MKNILLTGDVHIGTYNNFNFHSSFRKEQFIGLANRFVEYAKEKDCDTIYLLGDMLVVPNPSQADLNLMYEFLSILKSHFKEIGYILGNHDVAIRENTNSEVNSVMRLFHLNYLNNKIIDIEGVKLGFADFNWSGEIDIPECDIFLSHITISDGKNIQGQTIKVNKRLKECFAGDIHTIIDTTIEGVPFHTCNIPLQHNFGDNRNPSFIHLTINNGKYEWRRVSTESKTFKPLKMLYSYEIDDYNQDYEPKYVVSKFFDKTVEHVENKLEELTSVSTFEEIDNYIDDKEILQLIKSNCSITETFDIDLDFTLLDIEIQNFKSIEKQKFTFDKGLTLLYGLNGRGKSLIIQALSCIFQKHRYIKQYFRIDSNGEIQEGSVSCRFLYKNNEYIIYRGTKTKVFENGKSIELKQKELDEYIETKFSFIPYMSMLFRNNHQSFFSESNRLPVFNLLFRLDIIKSYLSSIEKLLLNQKNKIKELNKQKLLLEGEKNGIQINTELIGKELQNKIETKDLENQIKEQETYNYEFNTLQNHLNGLKEKVKNKTYKELKENIEKLNLEKQNLLNLKNELSEQSIKLNNEIIKLDNTYKTTLLLMNDKTCPTCKTVLEKVDETKKEELKRTIQILNNKSKEHESKFIDINNQTLDIKNQINNIDILIQEHQQFIPLFQLIENTETELLNLINPNKNVELLQSTLNQIKIANEKIILENERILQNNKNIERLKTIDQKILSINNEIEGESNITQRIIKVSNTLDFETPGSMTNLLLKSIAESMSTDDVIYKVEDDCIKVYYRVGDKLIHYDSLSEGQKMMVDLITIKYISSKVSIGLFTIDESLSLLDEINVIEAINILKDCQLNTVLIAGQTQIFSSLVDNIIEVTLSKDGISNYRKL